MKRKLFLFSSIIACSALFVGALFYGVLLQAQTAPGTPDLTDIGSPCPGIDYGGTVPTGFGAPYNVFSSTHELLFKPFCSGSSFVARFGYDTTGTVALYRSGYRWDGTKWVSMSYSPDGGTRSGYYIIGKARSSTQRYVPEADTIFIGFSCTYGSGGWKCGCKDTSCSTPYWQIQTAHRVIEAANVSVTVSSASVVKNQSFSVTYKNLSTTPLISCTPRVKFQYQSGSSWTDYTIPGSSTYCSSNTLDKNESRSVTFRLPTDVPSGTWRVGYQADSSHTFYSSNFTVTADSSSGDAPNVSINVSVDPVTKTKPFTVTYKNLSTTPLISCAGKVKFQYSLASGDSWTSYSVPGTSSSCPSGTTIAKDQSNTIEFTLPDSLTKASPNYKWRVGYQADSSHTFYSSNFNVTCVDPLDTACSPGHP